MWQRNLAISFFLLNIGQRTWFDITGCYQLRPSSWPVSLHCVFSTRSPPFRELLSSSGTKIASMAVPAESSDSIWVQLFPFVDFKTAEHRSHGSDCKGSIHFHLPLDHIAWNYVIRLPSLRQTDCYVTHTKCSIERRKGSVGDYYRFAINR